MREQKTLSNKHENQTQKNIDYSFELPMYKSLSNNVRYTFVGSFVFAMPSY